MANLSLGDQSLVTAQIMKLRDIHLTLDNRAGPVEILKSISLDVAHGRSIAIVGPSGSGKTSLLMVMAGLERPTSGEIQVAGHSFGSMTEDQLARARGADIGIVFQFFHLVPTMTALENVALPLEFSGVKAPHKVAEDFLSDVGLTHRQDHYPAQLSGGEQQRVALARALAPGPKLLLADEPTGNLDGTTGRQVVDLLFDLQNKKAATLVLVTHDETLAARCDRVVRMDDGRIVADHTAAAA